MRSTTISFSRSCSMGQGLAINRTSGTNFYVLDVLSIQSCLLSYQKKLHILILITNYKSMASTNGRPDTRTIGHTSGCKSGKQCFQSHLLHCMTYETSTGSSFLQPLHNSWRKGQCSMALRQQCLHSLESDNQICLGASNNTKWQWQMWMTNQSRDQI